jgi:hypothetical protein
MAWFRHRQGRSSLALSGFLAFPLGLAGCGGRSSAASVADASSRGADAGRDTGIDALWVDAANDTTDDVVPQDGGIEDAPTEAQADANECVPFQACAEAGGCGGSCVQTVCAPAPGPACACSAPSAIVLDPANGTCDCGFALSDHCVKPQAHCLCTSCGDQPGAVCVTDSEQMTICSGPLRSAFACP